MPEKQNIEYKSSWHDDYLKWVCGFANAQGGKIFIGIDDKGNISGVKKSYKLMEDIPNKIRNSMGIIADVSLHGKIGEEYIEVDVQPYPVAISYKGAFYRRSGSTNQRLAGAELESFLLRRRGANWESSPLPGLSLGDMDDKEISYFLQKALGKERIHEGASEESKEILLDKLHMIKSGYLTNAAALLFTKDPERWFTGAFIKVGYFESNAEIVYHDEVRGPLLRQIDAAMELIYFKYLKAKISYNGVQRVEQYPFPSAAIREALLNAIIHKQYESGIPIQVSVYDDKLYIANIGCIPEDWTVDNLLGKHASRPYNPNIANVFYLGGFVESWGRGVEKIFNACKDDNVPEPTYTIHPGDIMIKFDAPEDRIVWRNKPNTVMYDSKFGNMTFSEDVIPYDYGNKNRRQKTDGKKPTIKTDGKKPTIKTDGKKPTEKAMQQQKFILSFMKAHGKITTREAAELLSVRTTRAKEILYQLVKLEDIEPKGEGKNRCYVLKNGN